MCRDLFLSTQVVEAPLLATMHAADRQLIRLVKMLDGLVVLALPVLNDKTQIGVERINRQCGSASIHPRISTQPVEPMLTGRPHPHRLVAEVDDVSLVARLPARLIPR